MNRKDFSRNYFKKGLMAAVCFAALAAAPNAARAATFTVAYTATFSQGCTISCITFPPGLIETATFALPDSDLATPGTYDVSASYSNQFINPQTSPSAVADAIVVGGVVTDLTVSLAGSFPLPLPFGGTGSQSLSASGGSFTQNASVLGGSFFADGTYSITEQPAPAPEPGTVLLLGAGLLACVAVSKFARSGRTA